jgi:SAM-dependent methyltransferase
MKNFIKRVISAHFKKPAGLIGRITSNIMTKGNRSNYDVLLKDMAIRDNDKILEIGYGPGIGIGMIAAVCASCSIYGIDFSKLMYNKATATNKGFIEAGKVKLLYGDFISTDIQTGGFDKIFCINVVYFWNDLQPPFKKIKALLNSSGKFYFYMAHPDFLKKLNPADDIFNRYSIEEVAEALSVAGFSRVDHYFNKGYYITATA